MDYQEEGDIVAQPQSMEMSEEDTQNRDFTNYDLDGKFLQRIFQSNERISLFNQEIISFDWKHNSLFSIFHMKS
jgi:hypothetical protein